ncbi:unnamed protein product [Onchocerca ochengi]|uniref:Tox-ART-HYD1 domain-containing protein n=1 Tax=Onchocerca ochengi TaxID=42157 RepID=A0A182EI17_ONCOC|nr:unnamed protein product [Onchocerca ochengi]
MSSAKQTSESEYEIAYRSTIQPRTAVRTQSRQSGNYSTGTVVGGGGGKSKEHTHVKLEDDSGRIDYIEVEDYIS